MKISNKQIKALQGKCPDCIEGIRLLGSSIKCYICQGTGKATIEVEKEYYYDFYISRKLLPKYKLNDEISYCTTLKRIEFAYNPLCDIKLKIKSETEDTQTMIMVR